MRSPGVKWTPEEWQKAQRLLRHLTIGDVAKALGRTSSSMQQKILRERAEKFDLPPIPRGERQLSIPARVLEARDRRYSVLHLRTITQAMCGDPAPGYSALDRRHG